MFSDGPELNNRLCDLFSHYLFEQYTAWGYQRRVSTKYGLPMKAQKTAQNDNLNRLSRIEGQVRGVHRMISDDENSLDIVTQIQAARAALLSVSKRILEEDIRQRVSSILVTGSDDDNKRQLEEIMLLASKLGK